MVSVILLQQSRGGVVDTKMFLTKRLCKSDFGECNLPKLRANKSLKCRRRGVSDKISLAAMMRLGQRSFVSGPLVKRLADDEKNL